LLPKFYQLRRNHRSLHRCGSRLPT
jgi:hypothetical protein